MVTKRQFQRRGYGRTFFFICAVVVLGGGYLFAAERKDNSGPERYGVFPLKNISAQQGRKFLTEAKIGTVSQLPSPNTLLVTAQPPELIKARAILKLVDVNEPFVMKAIFPISEANNLPSNEQIEKELGDISIGTFSEPPTRTAKARAIIDIHNDAVVAIAAGEQIERIISAVERLQKAKALQPVEPGKPAEPNQPEQTKSEEIIETQPQPVGVATDANHYDANQLEEDELFDRLLGTLAETEEVARRRRQARKVRTEPAEPDIIEAAVDQQPPVEPAVDSGQLQQTDIVAILKRLDALEGYAGPQPAPEQVAVETKPPSEEAEPVSKVLSYAPEPISNGDDELDLDLPENVKIIDLLALVGECLHLDYMYEPAQIQGEVTLKLRGKLSGPIKVKDLYPLLESVLKFKGLAMTRKGNLVTIVPDTRVLEIDPSLVDDEAPEVQVGDVIITRIFKLKHIGTDSAGNLLKGMSLGIDINPSLSETGTLIVTGYAYRMARVEELLQMVDKPGKTKQFRFRQLKYTMAEKLVSKVGTLAEQLGTVSIAVTARAGRPATAAPSIKRRPGESEAAYRKRSAQESARAAAARAKARTRTTTAAKPAAAKPTVYLEADERTNRILMIGLQEQLSIVEQLIDTLDVQQQDLRTMRVYDIQYVGAEAVREKLEELGIISGGREARARTTTRTGRITAGKPTTTAATTGAKEDTPVEEPQVVIIESTDSLLVNATAEQHVQIAVIIGYVDREPEQAAINYVVYPLENQDPAELAEVLNQLITETTATQDKDAKIVKTTTTKRTEEDIIIISDPKTYSLIVYASKKNQQWIGSLIEQLDEYRPQVLLDVTLVEITKNDEFNLDLNLISSFPTLNGTSGLTGAILRDSEGVATKSSSDILDDLREFGRDRFIDLQSEFGAGTGFYGDEHINLLVQAMQTKNYGRVLARPKLLVNDNEAGTITSEETTYIVRKESTVIPGTTPGTSTTVAKEIFEDYSAGITLEIEPHISKGDQLRLKIILTRSDFRLVEAASDKPPDTVTSDVATVVTVPDAHTIILGGLEKLKQSKGGSKVPLLGDLPLIGGFFRSTGNSDSQSRLYVFVKAHILRPGEEAAVVSDIEVVSAKNRATFEKYEKEMQEYKDWPGITPEPMDPLQILEAD